MRSYFNTQYEVSPRTSTQISHQLWREIQTIEVIKYRPIPTPQGDVNSNRQSNPYKKKNRITAGNPDVTSSLIVIA